MVNRSGGIGTKAETATVRALNRCGFPHAERKRLRGDRDEGDITGTPGVCWEVKGGEAARRACEDASGARILGWLAELLDEQKNARADLGVLVVQRRGVGLGRAEDWWAYVWLDYLSPELAHRFPVLTATPVRMTLADACLWLRALGYGQPLDDEATA